MELTGHLCARGVEWCAAAEEKLEKGVEMRGWGDGGMGGSRRSFSLGPRSVERRVQCRDLRAYR
jgi:hypothetical protein